MRVKKPSLPLQILLLASLLGALGFLPYYRALYLPEISQGCTLILFVWLVVSTKTKKQGFYIVFLPAFLLALLVLLYAFVFFFRTGAPLLPSILAQRAYTHFLLAPVVYMLYLRGWRLADYERIFVLAAVLTMGGYVVALLTIDLESWARSGDFYKYTMVTYDVVRGYRLKGPLFTFVFVGIYFGIRTLQVKRILSLCFASALTVLSIALLISNLPRSTVVSTVTALVIYKLFLSRPRYARLWLLLFPLFAIFGVLLAGYVLDASIATFSDDMSYLARVETWKRAWAYFLEHPFLGFGQPSHYSLSFQDVMGEGFEPSDIGLLGVAFQYGLVGLFLYLFFSVWLFVNLLRLVWACRGTAEPSQGAFLVALLIITLSFLTASLLQAKFIYGEGIGFGAFSWGLVLAYKYGLPRGSRDNLERVKDLDR